MEGLMSSEGQHDLTLTRRRDRAWSSEICKDGGIEGGKLSEWRAWGTALGKHRKELRSTIAKEKRKLIEERIEAR